MTCRCHEVTPAPATARRVDDGLAAFLDAMRRAVRSGLAWPGTAVLVRALLTQSSDPLPLTAWRWFRSHVRWHPEHPEVIADLPRLVQWPAGDCDDAAVALATLSLAAGYEARWVLGYDARGPCHVWTEVRPTLGHPDAPRMPSSWCPIDPTPVVPGPGVSPMDIRGAGLVSSRVVTIGGLP